MKIIKVVFYCSALYLCGHRVQAQDIFVNLTSSGSTTGTQTINAPSGYSYSAAAPVSGTTWNFFNETPVAKASGTVAGTYTLFNASPLDDSAGTSISETLTISLTQTTTSTHANPASAIGENTIQSGGVMAQAWRNYNNSAGYYLTYDIVGLADSSPFDLYIEGGTTTSGQGAGITLAAGNVLGSDPSTGTTVNTTANSNGAFGSLFTGSPGSYSLMASGTTWLELQGQSDATGNFSFELNGAGSAAYLNGFQLVPGAAPEPSALALAGAGLGLVGLIRSRRHS
ncbi:MAG TPA: PEP-CTERM sorting domain-containing protein [Verrucomicrobiae bacterium]|jgi:hypothetical protein